MQFEHVTPTEIIVTLEDDDLDRAFEQAAINVFNELAVQSAVEAVCSGEAEP